MPKLVLLTAMISSAILSGFSAAISVAALAAIDTMLAFVRCSLNKSRGATPASSMDTPRLPLLSVALRPQVAQFESEFLC